MNICIITYNTIPVKAYFSKNKAYKEQQRLRDDKGPFGNYGLLILLIQDTLSTNKVIKLWKSDIKARIWKIFRHEGKNLTQNGGQRTKPGVGVLNNKERPKMPPPKVFCWVLIWVSIITTIILCY